MRSSVAAVVGGVFLALASAAAARPPLVVLSFDGFRWDYLHRPEARAFRALGRSGARARILRPQFPTKTYPNHFSLATGRVPAGHGILANMILDPPTGRVFTLKDRAEVESGMWWEAEPLWRTAERQGLTAGVFFWPGSEGPIMGHQASRWRRYDGAQDFDEQVETLRGWLLEPPATRPDLVMAYFREPDVAGHVFGPDAPEVDARLTRLGELAERLFADLPTPVNVLLVSDHGMTPVRPGAVVWLEDHLDLADLRFVDPAPVAGIWPKPGREARVLAALRGAHPAMKVYARDELPATWRYADHPRLPPIVAVVDAGWQVVKRRADGAPSARGMHGYPPEVVDMGGIFLARGPSLREGVWLGELQNTQVYALACRLLGVEPAPGADALGEAQRVLRQPR